MIAFRRARDAARRAFLPDDVRMTPETHPDQYANPSGLGTRQADAERWALERQRLRTPKVRRRKIVVGLVLVVVGVVLLAYDEPGVGVLAVGIFALAEVAWAHRRAPGPRPVAEVGLPQASSGDGPDRERSA